MDPEYLEGRLENFLHLFEGKLAALGAEDFAEHVQSLITKKSEKDRNVDRHCERLMTELCSHTYVWNRKELEVKALGEITQQDLVDFFARHLSVKSQTRRRICSHVVGRAALDVLKEAGVEPSVNADSVGKLLAFPPGSVPFPVPPAEGEAAEPPALPEPSVTSVAEYKKTSELLHIRRDIRQPCITEKALSFAFYCAPQWGCCRPPACPLSKMLRKQGWASTVTYKLRCPTKLLQSKQSTRRIQRTPHASGPAHSCSSSCTSEPPSPGRLFLFWLV